MEMAIGFILYDVYFTKQFDPFSDMDDISPMISGFGP